MIENDLKKIECPWASVKLLGNDPESRLCKKNREIQV